MNPVIEVIQLSATSGEGMDAWLRWLEARRAASRWTPMPDAAAVLPTTCRRRRVAEERRVPARERRAVPRSPLHGDLGDAAACAALDASVAELLHAHRRPVAAIAHDLHPEFYSTRLALALAAELGVPAIGVQHHHAHIAAVMAEHPAREPVVGLALDGVGLGTDGRAWGGELLCVGPLGFQRLGHLQPLGLPGGDLAAREPWRMGASVLHALGRGDAIAAVFAGAVGLPVAQGVARMLAQDIHCPPTSSMGRWFDAAAAALGLSVRQSHEAEAAIGLERRAAAWLAGGREPAELDTPRVGADGVLDLRPLLASLFATPAERRDEAAAGFHAALAAALVGWAGDAARAQRTNLVCLGGGCFFNTVLTERVTAASSRAACGCCAAAHCCGDAGLALGQAWVAALQLAGQRLRACERLLEAAHVSRHSRPPGPTAQR